MGKKPEATEKQQVAIGELQGLYMKNEISKQELRNRLDELIPLRSAGFVDSIFE